MNTRNPDVDLKLSQAQMWQSEMMALREICLGCGLIEEVKWGRPSYSYQNGNIVLIQNFKAYCALLFFKGSLLKDAEGVLYEIGENTQAGRQMRFTGVQEIQEMEPILKANILEAIEVEKAGLKVVHKETADYPVPEEFQLALDGNPALEAAFEALTPGRQRQYLLYFASAKQAKTRAARVEKYTPQILDGKGLND